MNATISMTALKDASSCDFYIANQANLQNHSLDIYYTNDEINLILGLLKKAEEKAQDCHKELGRGNFKHIVFNLPSITRMFKKQYEKLEITNTQQNSDIKLEQEEKLVQIKAICDLFLFYLSVITRTCAVDILLAEAYKSDGWLDKYRQFYQDGLIPMRVIIYLANFNIVARSENINPCFPLPIKTKFFGPISKATFQKNLICLEKTERTTLKAIEARI